MKSLLTCLTLLLTFGVAQTDIEWVWFNAADGTERGTFTTNGALDEVETVIVVVLATPTKNTSFSEVKELY